MNRIAIVTYSLRMGGIESVIFNLAKFFKNKKYEIEIIETLEMGVWRDYFIENKYKVKSFTVKPFETALQHSKNIADYLNKFDILLLNDAPYAQSIIGILKANILIFPIMHMELSSMARNAAGSRGEWNKIIAVSPLLKNYILKEVKDLNESDVVCIPNGIDVSEFIPRKKIFRSSKKKILYIGRISEEKGVRLLPEIISIVKENKLFDCLDIYGSGPLESELRLTIERLYLGPKMNMKGPLPHKLVSNILNKYDILIMPSYKEGLPMVLLEAMSCGIVPVVSRLAGSTDIVVNNCVNGYLCETGNANEFANYLNIALQNNDFNSISECARKTIVDKYTMELMCEKYLKLFSNENNRNFIRAGKIDMTLLGDLPHLFFVLVRPVRKLLRLLGVWRKN